MYSGLFVLVCETLGIFFQKIKKANIQGYFKNFFNYYKNFVVCTQ